MRTIAEDTVNTYQAFKEDAEFKRRHAMPSREAYWSRRIAAYQAVIDAVAECLAAERAEG